VTLIAAVVFSAAAASVASMAPPPPHPRIAIATRIDTPIVVDGVLDDPAWSAATSIGELAQREPRQGEPSTERTEIKLLYDRDNLYVGVICEDLQPHLVIGTQMARDADLDADDRIELLFDTFHDRRNAFYFATNPAGALVDGLIIENGELNQQWDGIWNVRVARSSRGWSAEFVIPFKTLTFDAVEHAWGFNVSRYIQRKLEEDRWDSPRLDVSFRQVSEAGELTGLGNVDGGRSLDVRPFLSARAARDSSGAERTGAAGVDAFVKLTPTLKLALTVNTDFAETEVDDRQINLTRFPLFFPEKRPFFLENTDVFSFSKGGSTLLGPEDFIPFFSRTIGLYQDKEVPVLAGLKLAGKAGAYDVGVLDVQTKKTGDLQPRNLLAARVKRRLFEHSYAGAIFTNGDPVSGAGAQTYGGDLRLGTSHFLSTSHTAYFDAFGLQARTPSVPRDNTAFGAGFRVPGDLIEFSADWKQIGSSFRPALGFVPRTNIRKVSTYAAFAPRPEHFLNIRQMFHEFGLERYTRIDNGQVETWTAFVAPVNHVLNSGDRYELNYAPEYERLFEPFEISPGVVLPAGEYRFTRWLAQFRSAAKRAWKFDALWSFGSYWSGRADEIKTTFQLKLAPHLQTTLSLAQTSARLMEGEFVARVVELRANYSFSPAVTVYNLVQFDNRSQNVGMQTRLRWTLQPGNDLFVVAGQQCVQDDERGRFEFRCEERRIASKIQYTLRF
jgi:hypothetical protein